jgi:hypothetical protein
MPAETVRIALGAEGPPELSRQPVARARRGVLGPPEPSVLRIVQIADPHLGPWQSVKQLRRRIER